MKQNIYQTLRVRKGNVYEHLCDDETQWLIDEAMKLNCDIGLVIASIIRDAYHEEVYEPIENYPDWAKVDV